MNVGKVLWCGGWDLNPRRPTPAGPEPAPFDLARAPPRPLGPVLTVFSTTSGYGYRVFVADSLGSIFG